MPSIRESRILVDSCVWIDSYIADHPLHRDSYEFLQEALRQNVTLLYGASKAESIFYILIAEVKRLVRAEKGEVGPMDAAAARSFAWGCVEHLRQIATAVGVDDSDLWLASKYRSVSSDLEDNILLAATQRASANLLVTWDKELLRSPVVRTATPAEARTLLSAGL